MWINLSFIVCLIFNQTDLKAINIKSERFTNKICDFTIDTLTGKVIYTSADILPLNTGGKNILLQRLFREVPLDDLPLNADFSTSIEVAFIVDTDGSIIGERIISGKSEDVGKMILKIVKQFKWEPAICNGKKVAMMYSIPIKGCPVEG